MIAALSFADAIRRNIGQLSRAVFIDLRKAFDTVYYGELLDKLSAVGVIGPEHKLFPDYLRNRTQDVEFHGLSSNPKGMSIGVPQGSIIGPLLFILHVNDLPEATFECSILLYTLRIQFCFCSSSQASTIE